MNLITKKKTVALIMCAGLTLSAYAAAPSVASHRDTISDFHKVYPDNKHFADYHKLRQSWYFNNYVALSDDNGSNYSGKNLTATDSEIRKRLNNIETDMELEYNESVKSYIDSYLKNGRKTVENMLGVSLYYMPIFEKALIEEGVPVELKYLPIIESAMQPSIKSSAKATGLWQFMYDTGKGMGLTINSLVDERCDPEKSSEAAAKFLKKLYDMYGDWNLALAAYNWGPGNVNKLISRYVKNGEKPDFWALRKYMPNETRNYVPKFIATVYIMEYYKEHGISPALAKQPILVDSVHVRNKVSFKQISEVLDIPIDAIRAFNPQYIKDIIPGDGRNSYVLKLRPEQIYAYMMSEDKILAHGKDKKNNSEKSQLDNGFEIEEEPEGGIDELIEASEIVQPLFSPDNSNNITTPGMSRAEQIKAERRQEYQQERDRLQKDRIRKNRSSQRSNDKKTNTSSDKNLADNNNAKSVAVQPKEDKSDDKKANNKPAPTPKKPEPKAETKKPEPKKPEPKVEPKKPEPKKPEPKADNKKVDPKKPDPKADNKKSDPKADSKKVDPKADNKKSDPKADPKKADNKKADPKADNKKTDPKKQDSKADNKKADPKADPKKADNKKADPKADSKKADPKKQDPKADNKKADPKKADNKADNSKDAKTKTKEVNHTVVKGESLEKIAKKHGTTVDNLRKHNNIKGDKIQPGQKLKVK